MADNENQPEKFINRKEFWDDFPFRDYMHDGFFKLNMRDLDFAREFFLWSVPEIRFAPVDLSRLEQEQESFLDDSLTKSFADLLFRAPLKTSGAEGAQEEPEFDLCVFFLIEHKSNDDCRTVFQVVRYIVRIWEQAVAENDKRSSAGKTPLPFVLPIIFYHGPRPFTGPTNLCDLIRPVPGLEKFLPNWPFRLTDVSQVSEDQMPKNWKLRLLIRVTQFIFREELLDKLRELYEEARPHFNESGAKEFFKSLLYYAGSSGRHSNPERFEEEVKAMSDIYDDPAILPWWRVKGEEIYEAALAEGKAEGKAEGIAEGIAEGKTEVATSLLKEGLSVEFIVKTTGLSEDEVKRLDTDR